MFGYIKFVCITIAFAFLANLQMFATINRKDKPMDVPVITTLPILGQFCGGEKLNVSFTVSADFFPENVFTAQLSDAMGNFAIPINIGILSSVTSGSILATLPKDLPTGFGYRIRVIGSKPESYGSDNGQDITINELPALNIDGNFEPCSGESYNYTTNSDLNNTYLWIVEGGEIQGSNNTTNLFVIWGTDSLGTLKLVKRNMTTNCTDTMTVLIDIKFKPETTIGFGDYDVCVGEVTEYRAAAGQIATDLWVVQGGNIISSDAAKAKVRWDFAGEGWIEMQKTNEFGCVGKDRKTVIVNPVPFAQIIGNNNAYSGKKTLYKSITEAGTGSRWEVTGGTMQSSTDDSVFITWGQPGTGLVRLIKYYLTTDCGDTSELNITINPGIPLGDIEGKDIVCTGKMESYSTEQVDNTYIKWYAQGGNIVGADNGFNINITWGATGNGFVKYILTEFGSGNKDSLTLFVTINPIPMITFPELADMCINDSPLSLNMAEPVDGIYTGEGVEMGYFYPDRAGAGSHEITYTFTNQFGCESSVVNTIIVNPKPEKPIITTTQNGFISNYDYGNQWFKDGEAVEGATEKELEYIGDGVYSVQVTDSNGCKSDMSDAIEVPVEEEPQIAGISIYPNPAGNYLFIKNQTNELIRKIEIVDIFGSIVYENYTNLFSHDDDIMQRLDIKKINNGFYLIKLYFSDLLITEKLIINR